jgi:SAM-dependent methyltransferase
VTEYDGKWWDDMWRGQAVIESPPDDTLVSCVEDFTPGRALELGCGAGANAVWLVEQGWTVEAIDFSEEAVNLGRRLAAKRGVAVKFSVGDATIFRPENQFDLIISFYIQLWPEGRATMLKMACKYLAPGGKLLFVSHDKSNPPPGWSADEFESLTTPDEIVAELIGVEIEVAKVIAHDEASHMAVSDESHAPIPPNDDSQRPGSEAGRFSSSSTLVLAVKT